MAKLKSDRCRDGDHDECNWPHCECPCHAADDPDQEYDR